MAETHSTLDCPAPAKTIAFEALPYRADGTIHFGSALQLVGMLGVLGIILGVISGYVSQYFYLVLLFPLLIGGCIGTVGGRCIKLFHVRNPSICGFAGFFVGCLAMFTMHYTEFQIFEQNLKAALDDEGRMVQQIALSAEEIHANWNNASPNEQAILTALENDPIQLMALRANNIWRFLDFSAHQGVELNNAGGGNGRGINLGYTGSYLYWIAEAFIVAVLAYRLMSVAASEPYCNTCFQWKAAALFGPFPNVKEIADLIKQGSLTHFHSPLEQPDANGMITLFTCPHCESQSTVDVRVERWTVNRKGEVSKKRMTQMTFPPEAIPVLQVVCAAPEEPVATAADASPSAENVG